MDPLRSMVARLRGKGRERGKMPAKWEADAASVVNALGGKDGYDNLMDMLKGALWDDAVWTSYNDEQKEHIYQISSVVFSCVFKIASTIPEAMPEVGMMTPDGFEPMESHEALELVENPNPDYDYNECMARIVAALLLTGTSPTWKWRTNGGAVGELWPMPSHRVKAEVGQTITEGKVISRLYKGFVVTQGQGMEIPVPPQDMMYGRMFDPKTTHDGVGPLEAALKDYQIDSEREDYLIEMLTNMKIAGLKVQSETTLTKPQKEDLRSWLHDKIGKGKRGNPLILSGQNISAEIMSPLKDLDWPSLSSLTETRICAAFGVPPILVGLRAGLERSTYSNYEEARRSFYQETMVPFWRALGALFTKSLLRQEGEERLEFRFNWQQIPALQEDAGKRAERATALLRSGAITRNETRDMVGLTTVPDGNVYLLPMTTVEVPARTEQEMKEQAALPPATEPEPEPVAEEDGEAA